MITKPKIVYVDKYRNRFITVYSDGSATIAGAKFNNIRQAKNQIDKLTIVRNKAA